MYVCIHFLAPKVNLSKNNSSCPSLIKNTKEKRKKRHLLGLYTSIEVLCHQPVTPTGSPGKMAGWVAPCIGFYNISRL